MTFYSKLLWLAVLAIGCLAASPSLAQSPQDQTVQTATTVLNEIMATPASSIPQAMLADARGLVIVPNVIKGGFVVGVRHGRGVVLVRDEQGGWGAPMFISLTGGSIGWQAGLQATDVILVFKTPKSVQGLLNGKFTIGADAAAAAGPVDRQAAAATDAQLRAEIYSYSRSRGLFAGVSLDGSALQIDQAATQVYYQAGGAVAAVPGAAPAGQLPPAAVQLMETVARFTTRPQPAPVVQGQPTSAPGMLASPQPAVITEPDLRAQLAAASQRLQPLLDANWQRFLAVPGEIYQGTNPPSIESLQQLSARFDTVASNPQYAALAQRQEFQATHQTLRNYLNARAANGNSPLNLPPPPGQAGNVR
jgi:lipid-binding SYLF domain-containing protein